MASDYIYIFCIPNPGSRTDNHSITDINNIPASSLERSQFELTLHDTTDLPAIQDVNAASLVTNTNMSIPTPRPVSISSLSSVTIPDDHVPLPARRRRDSGNTFDFNDIAVRSDDTIIHTFGMSPGMQSGGQSHAESSGIGRSQSVFEAQHALPPYTLPSLEQRSLVRRNRRRATRINLDGSRRCRRSGRQTPRLFLVSATDEGYKQCCSRSCCIQLLIAVTTFRWMLLFLSIIGVGCIISGIVLASIHMAFGSSFLTMSIMFIVLGMLLVVVFGIGWKCTPPGHEPCHLLFNLGEQLTRTSGIRGSHFQHRRRDMDSSQWFGGVIYSEFEYRAPPPSYADSLQDYFELQNRIETPPPPYRSQPGTMNSSISDCLQLQRVEFQPPRYCTQDGRNPILGTPVDEEQFSACALGLDYSRNELQASTMKNIVEVIKTNSASSRYDISSHPCVHSVVVESSLNGASSSLDVVLDNSVHTSRAIPERLDFPNVDKITEVSDNEEGSYSLSV